MLINKEVKGKEEMMVKTIIRRNFQFEENSQEKTKKRNCSNHSEKMKAYRNKD